MFNKSGLEENTACREERVLGVAGSQLRAKQFRCCYKLDLGYNHSGGSYSTILAKSQCPQLPNERKNTHRVDKDSER